MKNGRRVQVIPEPACVTLTALACVGLLACHRRPNIG